MSITCERITYNDDLHNIGNIVTVSKATICEIICTEMSNGYDCSAEFELKNTSCIGEISHKVTLLIDDVGLCQIDGRVFITIVHECMNEHFPNEQYTIHVSEDAECIVISRVFCTPFCGLK